MGWPVTINEFKSFNQSINWVFNVFTLAWNSQKFRTCVDSTMTLWMWLIQSPILSQLYTLERLRDLLRVTGAGPESLMVEWVSVMSSLNQPEDGTVRFWPMGRGDVTCDPVWRTDTSLTESGMQQQQQQHQRHVGSCCCCGVEEEIMRSFVATFFHLNWLHVLLKPFSQLCNGNMCNTALWCM